MAKRQSTGKRLRFEVFKRDGFTCQYCGAQPPAVVLVIDHAEPVTVGGASTPDNLITACEPCNQGKADRPLGDRIVRPDADLMYLEAQQEIAELRRFQAVVTEREAEVAALIAQFQEAWTVASDLDWCPKERVLRPLIQRYGGEAAYAAIIDVAGKVASRYVSDHADKWVPYLYIVARRIVEEPERRPVRATPACHFCRTIVNVERINVGRRDVWLCPGCEESLAEGDSSGKCPRCKAADGPLFYALTEQPARHAGESVADRLKEYVICQSCFAALVRECWRGESTWTKRLQGQS